MLQIIVVFLCLLLAVVRSFDEIDSDFIHSHQCSLCLAVVDNHLEAKVSLNNACLALFPENVCDKLALPKVYPPVAEVSSPSVSRSICQSIDRCPMNDKRESSSRRLSYIQPFPEAIPDLPAFEPGAADVRITRAMGSRGYDKIRVSVISNRTFDDPIFTYKSQFKYRWTEKYLSTGIVTVPPGKTTTLRVAGADYDVFLPRENAGVRGIIFADPCFQSDWLICLYQSQFDTFRRHTEFLNAAFAHRNDVHYWQILGDNFYDQEGSASSVWFSALTAATKSAFFATVPGNHDFWINARPDLYVPKDQLGVGFMQFYGQDVIASMNSDVPYDFSVHPDHGAKSFPTANNYFFYNKVGNVAFIGYSGAHKIEVMEPYFKEACNWARDNDPDVLLLLGHWHSMGNGCKPEDTTPAMYNHLISMPECAPLEPKLRYFMGHKHCNIITQKDIGFMVGAQGMADASSCFFHSFEEGTVETSMTWLTRIMNQINRFIPSSWFKSFLPSSLVTPFTTQVKYWWNAYTEGKTMGGALGIPVVDTTNGRFRVFYFPLAQADQFDDSEDIIACVRKHGVSGCYHLATVWADVPLDFGL